jgi:hypothetical protein
MTPKEKAQELVNKMFNCDKSTPEESMAMLYPHAKQCALIAVDEIINTLKTMHKYMVFPKQVIYWQEVKTEIEKL